MDVRWYLTVAILLFVTGMAGFLIRRNLLVVLLSLELMLNAGALALLSFSRVHGDALGVSGQAFFFLIIALAAAESAVGLSLIIATYRLRQGVDSDELRELRG